MKAIRFHSYGHSDRLQLEDAPPPRLKEGEVLVRVRAAGVNPVDWKIREGALKEVRPQSFPAGVGQDVAGEIAQAPPSSGFSAPDRVYGLVWGAYAEFAAARPEWLAPMPRSLGFDEAAAVPLAGLTAWQAVEACAVSPGQRVLIHGAAGGVGSFAAQLCRWKGARVTATASELDFPYLRSLGVEPLIDYRRERFEQRAGEVDAVIDLIGGETLERSYGLVRREGAIVTTLGRIDERACEERGIRGVALFMKADGAQLRELSRLIDEGFLRPRLDRILPLDSARQAQDLSQQGRAHGKIVLHVA